MKLTANDIGILIEALDAWIEKDAAGEILGHFLTAALGARGPEEKRSIEHENARIKGEAAIAKEQRKEVATLLKATLIRMRRDLQSEEYAERRP